MKTIGLLGGMSWQSTLLYYQIINRVVAQELGGLHSAKIVLRSVDFHEIADHTDHGRWAEAGQVLAMEARALKAGGADFAVLCTNTMHKVADAIVCGSGLALIHIVDVAAGRLTAGGIRAVGLLGTRFVMEEDFYGGEMSARHGVDVLLPGEADRAFLHAVIYGELAKGLVTSATRDRCQAIIADLASQGAQAILLACTELPLVVSEADHAIPIYSTTTLHAQAAARLALGHIQPMHAGLR